MIFEIINNIIENILMSYFISSYLQMKEKKYIFIFSTVFMNTVLSTILTNLNIIGIEQTMLIQICIWINLYIFHKQFSVQDIKASLFCNVILYIATYFTMLSFSFLHNVKPIEVFQVRSQYVACVVIVKIVFLLLSIGILKKRPLILNNTKVPGISYLVVAELLIIMIMAYYFVSMVLSIDFDFSTNIIFSCFVVLFVILCYTYDQLIMLNKEVYENKLKKQQEKYIEENLKNIKLIKYELDNTEHRLNYILQSIKYDLEDQNYNDAIAKIEANRDVLLNVSPVFSTKNELFDFLMNLEIKSILSEGYRIKVCAVISEHQYYNDLVIINRIINFLKETYKFSNYVELFLMEKDDNILEIKCIISYKGNDSIKKYFSNLKEYNFNIRESDNLLILSYNEDFQQHYD